MYGEAGLRERLLLEIRRFPAATAAAFATRWRWLSRLHARDRRQREPYVDHPLRVTIRILSHYRVTDADVLCAALLHDTVEDHADDIAPGGGRQAALAVLAGGSASAPPGLWPRSPTRSTSPAGTSTSSTASTSSPAWRPAPGRG